ncbi:FadR/GntR family transcriptional regulator [Singulisphaera sp. PoT]|uniref:FadR/GntR family transcriptional regulator n=1 Tax=Singulisphaera sp. PoT TaxID=3411797 RepID=UPI003BF4BC93
MGRDKPDHVIVTQRGQDDGLVRRLMALIHEKGLKVGDQLPNIRLLATMLDVKPTTVRDALLQAQTLGLVRILPRSGAYIQSLSYTPMDEPTAPRPEPVVATTEHNLFHLLDARRVVEIELVGRAAERRVLEELLPVREALEAMARIPETELRNDYVEADIRFHAEIARLGGNSVLLAFLKDLLGLLRPHLAQIPWSRERRQTTDAMHAEVYSALVSGDAARARAVMGEHLGFAYENLLREVQSVPTAPPRR